jgi:glycosyltransferase involved in cell wall biosynthesis
MRVLHLCTYYIGSKLYSQLFKELSKGNITQEVFIPIRKKEHEGINRLPEGFSSINYYYSNIIKKYHKIFYYTKINKQLSEIERLIDDISNINFIHAHTLFSDGGTAYKLHKKYGNRYLVTVRNTDINFFFKYGLHLRRFMIKVLMSADSIVFLSHSYKLYLLSKLPASVVSKIESKCYVIPNGIDDFWFKYDYSMRTPKENLISLLFIGKLEKNKNVEAVIESCSLLNKRGYNTFLHVIGSGSNESELRNLVERYRLGDKVKFHGFIKDKQQIAKIIDNCDVFVMPSIRETFGLSYIESMSRGLPVIYTKGQGIDGYFEDGEVGFPVDPHNIEMIVEYVLKIMGNYEQISSRAFEKSRQFNWSRIANHFYSIYCRKQGD